MERTTHDPSERDEIRALLAENIRALDARAQAAREDGVEGDNEHLQLKRLRTLAQLARQYRLLARDADVDEMEDNVDLLREALDQEGES